MAHFKVIVSKSLISPILSNGFEHHIKCIEGIPEDSELVEVFQRYGDSTIHFNFRTRDASITDGQVLEPKFEIIRCQSSK